MCKCHLIATELLQQPGMLCILLFFACIWFKRNSSLGSNLACRAFLAWGSITYIRQWARNLFSVVGKLQEGRFKASLGKKASEAGRVTRGANCQGALLSVLVPSCWGESVFAGVPYDMYKLSLQCSRDVCLLGWVMTAYKNTLSVINWWLLGCCSRGRTDVLQDFWSVQGGLRQQNEVAPAPQLSWDRLPSCIFALAANRKAWPHMYSLLLAIFNIYHENAMKKGSCNVNLWLSSSLSTLLFLVPFPPTLFLVWIIYSLSLSPQHAHALFVTLLLPISNSQSWACTPSQAAQPHASAAVTEFLSPPYMFLSPPCSVLPRTQGVALQPLDLQRNSEQELAWISLSCSRTKQLFSAPPHPQRLSGGQLSASDLPSANKPCCSSAQMWWCWSRTNTNKIRFVF